ncbi:MAG: PQQ-dependent sugar dehydrogenase [Planctomycetes bacterium]|nr:PQQ-dependent sugar dehydrogenase [Planctomycetota bacterium]
MAKLSAGVVLVCAAGALFPATAQTIGTELKVSGLVRPIFVTHAPNDFSRIFIIEKQGRIRIAQITPSGTYTLLPTSFLDVDAITAGGTTESSEQGLLGLAFSPNYPADPRFFINYTATAGSGDTVVAAYTVSANPNIANTAGDIIMTFDQPQTNHNGGWLAFGPDGYLYIGTGDGGNRDDSGTGHTEPGGNAHDLTSNRLGKILRIDVNSDAFPADGNRDYAIPPTNPFASGPNDGEIWDFGLRNPWRPSFDRVTGDLWIADVGQDQTEEINFEPTGSSGGRDYGWRCREGNHDWIVDSVCTGLTFTEPIYVYSHSTGCSITGGYVYRGCAIPSLVGAYFFADYCTARIWSMRYNGATITEFIERTASLDPPGALAIASVTSFGDDAYGELYICDSTGGEVFKIVPTSASTPDCNGNGRNDWCEIMDGSAADGDGDGILDVCECVGDFNNDGVTNLTDLAMILSGYGACTGDPLYNPVLDLVGNGCIDLSDLTTFLANFGCN